MSQNNASIENTSPANPFDKQESDLYFCVEYKVPHIHEVVYGVWAPDEKAAQRKVENAFDNGTLWLDEARTGMVLLHDDYEEVDHGKQIVGGIRFKTLKPKESWDVPDETVRVMEENDRYRHLLQHCESLLAGIDNNADIATIQQSLAAIRESIRTKDMTDSEVLAERAHKSLQEKVAQETAQSAQDNKQGDSEDQGPMLYYSISGRLHGSDEASTCTYQARSSEAALLNFIMDIAENEFSDPDELLQALSDGEGIYVDSMLCSATPLHEDAGRRSLEEIAEAIPPEYWEPKQIDQNRPKA